MCMSRQAADESVAEAQQLFAAARYDEAASRYERASRIFPAHPLAWKGLGHSLLCLGKPHDAAGAFDRAIGLAPKSATALWGGAVAHAEIGNKVIAQNYLHRTLVLQPTWVDMARGVPQLAQFLTTSTRAASLLHGVFGTFSTRTYRHTADESRAVEVGRIADHPRPQYWTYVTIGLSNHAWSEAERPRVELVLSTIFEGEICAQILANLAFHLDDTGFFPQPGVMVRDVLAALGAGDISQRLPHVYIGVPRAWKLDLPLDDLMPAITLAQVIPVSEAEYAIWRTDPTAFELSFLERRVDVADLRRPG
jgi:tetratricopeptide (TPR) repeat protein